MGLHEKLLGWSRRQCDACEYDHITDTQSNSALAASFQRPVVSECTASGPGHKPIKQRALLYCVGGSQTIAYREAGASAAAAAAAACRTTAPTVGRAVEPAVHPRCRRLSPTDTDRRRRLQRSRRPVARMACPRLLLLMMQLVQAAATRRHRQRSLQHHQFVRSFAQQ